MNYRPAICIDCGGLVRFPPDDSGSTLCSKCGSHCLASAVGPADSHGDRREDDHRRAELYWAKRGTAPSDFVNRTTIQEPPHGTD